MGKPIPCPPALDPLVQKAYHNNAVSPLCRIPDELLLQIMGYLDSVPLACLRRTSRIFLRLYSQCDLPLDPPADPGPWPCMSHLNFINKQNLRTLLSWDKFCGLCFEARSWLLSHPQGQTLSRSRMYCNACRTQHSEGLFSRWERNSSGLGGKVCVAHEGHLRVCQHRVVRWADIRRWSAFLTASSPDRRVLVCGAPSHVSQCGNRDFQVENVEMGGGVFIEMQMVEPSKLWVTLEWDAHVSVPHREGSPGTYYAHDVRSIAEELHADAGRFIIPGFEDGEPPHMAAFDPNNCGCLQYAGRGLLDWQMPPPEGTRTCCRTSRKHALFDTQTALKLELGVLWRERQTHAARWDVGGRQWPRSLRIEFGGCCVEEGGTGVRVSHRQSFSLSFERRRWSSEGEEPGPAAPNEWYRVMDPASYGLEGDAASRNLLWCPEEWCANHVSRAVWIDRFRDMASLMVPREY